MHAVSAMLQLGIDELLMEGVVAAWRPDAVAPDDAAHGGAEGYSGKVGKLSGPAQ
jgi:hypothetical protein